MANDPQNMAHDISQKKGLYFYQFPNLSRFEEINHAVFTRLTGFSHSPYDSLNVGLSVGDDPQNVIKNRNAIATCLGGDELIFAHQVHGTGVISLKKGEKTNPSGQDDQTGDALITDIPGKILVVQIADCQPILLFEPKQKVVAAIHSGWRGSLQNIIGRTIERMTHDFHCIPENIFAGIGPSLGPCCGEFVNYKKEIPKQFWCHKNNENHFNFWALSQEQLYHAGVIQKNIHSSGLCTKCRQDLFFSYRRQRTTGRFAGAIGLH